MKKLSFAILAVITLAVVLSVRATPTVVGGSPLVVNNASANTTPVLAFTYNPVLQQYTLTHGALGSTNDIQFKIYSNVANTTNNAVQIGVWYPSTTNAATETIYAASYAVTNYTYATVVTTNSQSLYVTYGQ